MENPKSLWPRVPEKWSQETVNVEDSRRILKRERVKEGMFKLSIHIHEGSWNHHAWKRIRAAQPKRKSQNQDWRSCLPEWTGVWREADRLWWGGQVLRGVETRRCTNKLLLLVAFSLGLSTVYVASVAAAGGSRKKISNLSVWGTRDEKLRNMNS